MRIEITAMRLAPHPSGETRILANFDLWLKGLLELRGCALVQAQIGLEVWGPPIVRKADDNLYGFKFAPSLRRHVIRAAKKNYDAMVITNIETPQLSAAVELVRELEERDAA